MENRLLFKRLLTLTRSHRRTLISGVGLMIVTTLLENAVLPVLLIALLFVVIGSASVASSGMSTKFMNIDLADYLGAWIGSGDRMSILLCLALITVCVMFIKCCCQAGQNYLTGKFSQGVARDLRTRLWQQLLRLSPAQFDSMKVGAWVVRLTWDVSTLRECLGSPLTDAVKAPVGIIVSLGMMFAINWRLTLVALALAPVIALIVNAAGRRIRRLTAEIQEGLSSLNATLTELISGIRVVQSFCRESHETSRVEKLNDGYYRSTMRAVLVSETVAPGTEFASMIGVILGFVVGGAAVFHGMMRAEGFILFLALGQRVGDHITKFARLNETRQRMDVATTRIFDVLDRVPVIRDLPGARPLGQVEGRVTFEHVSFHYGANELVMDDIDLDVAPGEVIALVGSSGAGKTTFVNLIPRFYDPTEGRVLVDGIDIREVILHSLRGQIAIVPQDTVLFSGTIAENIRYGRLDATDTEVRSAAEAANAVEFIDRMPDGLDTVVGERGARLSGGQRQRIAIARAVLRDPRILILDEATSSLDTASEYLVQQALDRLMRGRTTFVIAHRLSTIHRADRIVVIDKGRVVQMGTHADLLDREGLYRMLYEMQFQSAPTVERQESVPSD